MPIYEYRCLNPKCLTEYEYLHLNRADEASCPKCASKDAEKRVSSNTSHQLKGGGWYRDGYAGKRKN